MIDPKTGAPTEAEPSVIISGRTLILRNGVLSAYQLSLAKIDPNSIFFVNDNDRKTATFAHVMKLFHAVIAHNFIAQKEPVPTVEELLLQIEAEPAEVRDKLIGDISSKTMEIVYPKLWALTQEIKLRETAPGAGLAN